MRRALACTLSVAIIATMLAARASADPPAPPPDGVYARPSYTSVVPPAGALRAGAASGDISPPFGTSSTGFFADRHCAASTALYLFARTDQIRRDVEGDPTEAPYAPSSCVGGKLGPDTDGYSRTHPPSTGRWGRLRANAFVLDDGSKKLAIVSVDLPAFFGEMHQAVANRIAPLGIPRENLLVSASHTHSGPGGYFGQGVGWVAGGDTFDPRVFDAITGGIADAIARAHSALRPARLAAGTALADGLNRNRRNPAWDRNPEAAVGLDPRNAPRVGMIRIDGIDGRPIGAITNFATHGTVVGADNEWLTGDDKAWVSRLVEAGIGEGAVVASLNGAQGDIAGAVADTGGWPGGSADWGGTTGLTNVNHVFSALVRIEDSGRKQAVHQLALWESLGAHLAADVSLDARMDSLCFCGQPVGDDPYDPFDRGAWEPAHDDPTYRNLSNVGALGADGQRAPATVLPGHHRKVPLVIAPPPAVQASVRVQVARIGRVALATVPGEPTVTMGRRIERSVKAALNGAVADALVSEVWVAGLGNDHAGYFPTIQEYEAYLYEGTATMFGQQSGNAVKGRLVELGEQIALGAPTPACTVQRWCADTADISALATPPQPVVADIGAGTILAQPANVERFRGTSFTWAGGGPSAEFAPGKPFARLQRNDGGAWVDVASDIDPVIPVRYRKRYGQHRYTAMFDPTADWPSGTYRFVVSGAAAGAAGARAPYGLTSAEFTVSPSTRLALVKRGAQWDIERPAPDPWVNFRWRARHATAAVAEGTLNGAPVSFTGSIALAPGDELVVPAGSIRDEWGNTNALPYAVQG